MLDPVGGATKAYVSSVSQWIKRKTLNLAFAVTDQGDGFVQPGILLLTGSQRSSQYLVLSRCPDVEIFHEMPLDCCRSHGVRGEQWTPIS